MNTNRVIRLLVGWVILIALLSLAFPASAQNVTPDPVPTDAPAVTVDPVNVGQAPTTTEIVLIVALFMLLLACAFMLNKIVELAHALRDMLPVSAIDVLQAGGERGIEEIDEFVETTPNQIDDATWDMLKPRLILLLKELDKSPIAGDVTLRNWETPAKPPTG